MLYLLKFTEGRLNRARTRETRSAKSVYSRGGTFPQSYFSFSRSPLQTIASKPRDGVIYDLPKRHNGKMYQPCGMQDTL